MAKQFGPELDGFSKVSADVVVDSLGARTVTVRAREGAWQHLSILIIIAKTRSNLASRGLALCGLGASSQTTIIEHGNSGWH